MSRRFFFFFKDNNLILKGRWKRRGPKRVNTFWKKKIKWGSLILQTEKLTWLKKQTNKALMRRKTDRPVEENRESKSLLTHTSTHILDLR